MSTDSRNPAPFRLGVSAFIARRWLSSEDVDTFSRSPVAALEIAAPWFFEAPGSDIEATTAALLAAPLERWSVHAPFGRDLDLSSLDDEVRSRTIAAIAQAFRFAADLGCQMVVVHPSAEPIVPEERPARLARARASLAAIAELARPEGPRAAIEPLPRTCLGNSMAEMALLLEGLPGDRVGVCLDVNHANVGQDLVAFIEHFGPRIWTLHVSDNDGIDEKHWLPGEGVIDWQSVIAALRGVDYAGPFLYEVVRGEKALEERLAEVGLNHRRLMAGEHA